MHDTLADFVDAIDAFNNFGDAGPDDPIRDPGEHGAESDSPSGFMNWLSRRPR
jgi:hypothetical protein